MPRVANPEQALYKLFEDAPVEVAQARLNFAKAIVDRRAGGKPKRRRAEKKKEDQETPPSSGPE